MSAILIDTCILIDYLRNRPEAVAYFDSIEEVPYLSAITVGELYGGVREGEDRTALKELVSSARIIPISEEIAREGGLYRRNYHKSHGVGIADAIIAASADSVRAKVITRNIKHFPMAKGATSPY